MDVPGLTKEDIAVSRQNVVTVVQGKRKRLYSDTPEQHTVVKQERKCGDFTMTFRIPESFERKWSSYEVKDGVLLLKYERDVEDGEDGETKPKV
jgi:HSP20 family molecular chaperone IbpA